MAAIPKQQFIELFFDAFEQKIARLQELRKDFPDEAFTLSVLYIDRLASGRFGGKAGQNGKNFCRALRELSGNPLFRTIHPRHLKERAQPYCLSAAPFIESVISRQPSALLDEDELAGEIQNSSLLDNEKAKLIDNLWRGTIANIVYELVRNPEVHGSGSGGLSFDATEYKGRTGVTLDFKEFYDALKQILQSVRKVSMETGHWYGNPNYLKHRH